MRRVVLWTVVVLTALVLQSTVFAQISLGGTKPDLVYLVTIVLAFLLGQLHVGAGEVVRVALLTGLYNAVLTPILFTVIRRVAEASRAKKVFRW